MGDASVLQDSEKIKVQVRCVKCKKLLVLGLPDQHFEVKCARCGELNDFFDDKAEQVSVMDQNRKIIYINHALEAATGYSLDEVIGKSPKEFWGGQMGPEFYQEMSKAIEEKKEIFRGLKVNKRKNGEKYKVSFILSPVLNPKGEVVFYSCIEIPLDNLGA